MMSLPFRVACILIAGFLIVLVVTYIYKLNSRKVFWGVGLTTIIGILILLGLGVLRPSWGTETGTAVIANAIPVLKWRRTVNSRSLLDGYTRS